MKGLLKNTSWIILSQIFQMIIGFFVGLFTVRYLGPSNYGDITYIASYISFFSAICTLGLDTVIVNRLVLDSGRDGEIIASGMLLRSITSLVSMSTLVFVIFMVDHNSPELLVIAGLSSFELFFKAFGTIGFWYQFKLMSKKTALCDMLAFTIASCFRIWLLVAGKNVYWFACYNSVVFALIAALYMPMFLKDCPNRVFVSKEMCMILLKACIPYMLSAIMVSLYTQIDRVMIKQILHSSNEVGYYASAINVCNLIAFIPSAITLSSRPILMKMKRDHAKDYNQRVTQVLASIIWFSILYSLIITIFSKQVILLLYGSPYLPAASILQVLVWCTLFENLTKIRDMWLIGEEQSKYVMILSFIGTVINVVLNFALINTLGTVGAAIATVITQTVISLIIPLIFSSTRQYSINVFHAITLHNIDIKGLWKLIVDSVKPHDKEKGEI